MSPNDLLLLDSLVSKSELVFGKDKDIGTLFELFSFNQILINYELTNDEIEFGMVDGKDDGGIDGFYFFVDGNLVTDFIESKNIRRNPNIELIVITSKHNDSFKQVPINNLISSLVELLNLQKNIHEILYPFNQKLAEIRELFRREYIELADRYPATSIRIIYVSRGTTLEIAENIQIRADELKLQISNLFSNVDIKFQFVGATELLELARKQKAYSLRLKFVENTISRTRSNYVLLSTISDYYNFITDEENIIRRYLFEANVRDFVGTHSAINQDILESLQSTDNKDTADFWWFNNGITLIASKALIVGKEICIDDVQIVNGLQTTFTIYDYCKNNCKFDDRALLIKIVVTNEDEIRDRIIKATNSQTKVDVASLRATEKFQRDIELFLLNYNWYYDRRKKYYANQGKPNDRIISLAYLGNAVRALALKSPTVKGKINWIQSNSNFATIFNEKFELNLFLTCLEIFKTIDMYLQTINNNIVGVDRYKILKWRQIIAFLYITNKFGTNEYSIKQLTEFKDRPTLETIVAIVNHLKACKRLDEIQYLKAREIPQFAKYDILLANALEQLSKNNNEFISEEELIQNLADKYSISDFIHIAGMLEKREDFESAIDYLQICLQKENLKPKIAEVQAIMGRVFSKMKQFENSKIFFEKAISNGLESSPVYAGLARSLQFHSNDFALIEKYYLKAIEIDSQNALAHNWYAFFLKKNARNIEAEKHLRKTCNINSNNPLFLNNLGCFLMDKNEMDGFLEAKSLFEKAVRNSKANYPYPKMNLQKVNDKINSLNDIGKDMNLPEINQPTAKAQNAQSSTSGM